MIKNLNEVIEIAKSRRPKTIAVACAQDLDVLLAVDMAKKEGIADAILVGDKNLIEELGINNNLDLSKYEILDVKDLTKACLKAVELVSTGRAHMVMKGIVDTSIILKAVLNKEYGLRTGNVLSHVAVFDVPDYHKLLLVTDAAMNIAPDLNSKKMIIENSIIVTKALDIEKAKVAVLCAKEKVNPKMPATIDAAELQKMNEAGEISGCIVGGPLALDLAVSKEAGKLKNFNHPVVGDADVLLAPNIESGNILYKSLGFLTKSKSAGIIVGAKAPVVLTSRADDDDVKMNSIALGVLMAAKS